MGLTVVFEVFLLFLIAVVAATPIVTEDLVVFAADFAAETTALAFFTVVAAVLTVFIILFAKLWLEEAFFFAVELLAAALAFATAFVF